MGCFHKQMSLLLSCILENRFNLGTASLPSTHAVHSERSPVASQSQNGPAFGPMKRNANGQVNGIRRDPQVIFRTQFASFRATGDNHARRQAGRQVTITFHFGLYELRHVQMPRKPPKADSRMAGQNHAGLFYLMILPCHDSVLGVFAW
jgi:hypothetical protein